MRILLVDDDHAFHACFADMLRASGVRVRQFTAVGSLAEACPLLDGMDADLCCVQRRLLASASQEATRLFSADVPLILLADEPPADGAAREGLGADDLLKTELTPALLRHAIRGTVRATAAERSSRKAETLIHLIEAAGGIGTWDWDLQTDAVIWSPNLFRIFGVPASTPEDRLFQAWVETLHPEDREAAQDAARLAVAGAAPLRSRFRILRPGPGADGHTETRWLVCNGEVLRDAAGRPTRMIGINIDVTDHRRALSDAEEERASSEARFRTFFESAAECMFVVAVQPDGRFIYEAVNPAGLAATGAPAEAFLDRTPEDVLGPVKGAEMTEGLRRVCETGAPFHYQPTWELPGGRVTYDASYLPLRGAEGSIIGVLGVARDVTAERELRLALQQGLKLETLGQLASGIAHDFNNVLASFQACMLLLRKETKSARAHELLEEGLHSVQRGKSLTERLLGLARPQPAPTAQPVDLNAAIQSVEGMLRRAVGPGIQLQYDLAAALPPALTDRAQIELAVLNLAINARDAMPDGGLLILRTGHEAPASGPAEHQASDHVVVEIVDTGTGMAPEVLARAPDPFFTTKPAGAGTGLGLTMVKAMLAQFGGRLLIESRPGQGTTVALLLRQARSAQI